MPFAVNNSCVESLSVVAAQHWGPDHPASHRAAGTACFKAGPRLDWPADVRDYLRLKLVDEPNEVFVVVFMDNLHQVLACEPMFRGTINSATVHARVIVQRALALNAAAVILSHQHPSGATEPSNADRTLTHQLEAALALIDVRVLDHIIIGKGTPFSFAERGLL